jgi:hypothetical protein
MRKLDGRLDNQLIIRIAGDIAHERLVYLELFNGQFFQVCQRGLAGSEIIYR